MNEYLTDSFRQQVTNRLIALWALNEAALGGVLLAFRIPFTGLFIGSGAVIIISLIAFFNKKPGTIIRAVIIVMIVKGLVSPHTPITSYAAVMLQAMIGEIVFRYISWRSAAFILAVTALLLSALQKFLIITLVFGMNIWESIDLFGNFIINLFFNVPEGSLELSISFILISVYTLLHLLAGLLVGILLPKLAHKIDAAIQSSEFDFNLSDLTEENTASLQRRRRRYFKKISAWLLFALVFVIMIMSYIFPVFEQSQGYAAIIMVLRSVIIMSVWYFILGPVVLKRLKKYLATKEHVYSNDIKFILDLFPLMRRIINYCWQSSSTSNRIMRIPVFLFNLLVMVIRMDFST